MGGVQLGSVCVFVKFSSVCHSTAGLECTNVVLVCSDTSTLHAVTGWSQLAADACVSSWTNKVVERSSCDLGHLYRAR